jgi:N-acetyl-anhydromuramyl-L-alanine amidase AmpD
MKLKTGQLRTIALKSAVLGLLLCNACASPTFRTYYKPVVFDGERKRLSLEYMEKRHGMVQDSPYIKPKMIVLHWTAIPTLEQSFDAMNPVLLPGSRSNLGAVSTLNVSTQFLVDRDGTIFRQLPDTAFARHVIGLNHCAIGVENVGGAKAPLTKAQLKANEQLIRYLKRRYDIEYLIGHYEYKDFIGHELWKETDPGYLTEKVDPGELFMQKIRKRTKDLELKGAPAQ